MPSAIVQDMMHEDEAIADLEHSDESFGSKTIGSFAGTMLLVNNMMGVGIPLLPALFLDAGFVTPIVVMFLVAVFSGYAGSMLAEAMKYVPGNTHFEDRIEYASLCKFYLGKWPYWFIQFLLNMSLLSMNLVSILLTVQVMDWTIIAIFKCSYGLVLVPSGCQSFGFQSVCVEAAGLASHANSPFGDAMVISLGFLVSILIVIPMGVFNLEDNMGVQVASTGIQTLILIQWMVTFFTRGFSTKNVRAFGTTQGQGSVLGQIVLNYAYVMTVPSWANEKRRSSNVNKCVWWSVGISTFFFFIVGFFGALSFPDLEPGEDILTAINKASGGSILDQISVYLFPMIAVASSIPVFSIIVRYNLMENNICGKLAANLFAVVLPWILAIPLTAGNKIFNAVATYSSILFVLPVNLVIPFILYVMAMRRKAYLKSCYCEPGPCVHDKETAPLLSGVEYGVDYGINGEPHELRKPISYSENDSDEHKSDEDMDMLSSTEKEDVLEGKSLLRHRHVLDETGHVHKQVQLVPREVWADKHPKCARMCCASYVSWRNKPSVSPLAPFSRRWPRVASCLPARYVAWLDIPATPAPEHFALPKRSRTLFKQGMGLVLTVTCLVLLVASLALAVYQNVDPERLHNMTLNLTHIELNCTGKH